MPRHPRLDAPETLHHVMGRGLRVQKYSGRIRIGRIFFLHLESGGENGISGGGGGMVSWRDDIGGNPSGLFGGTALTPKVSVSSFRKNDPFSHVPLFALSVKGRLNHLTLGLR